MRGWFEATIGDNGGGLLRLSVTVGIAIEMMARVRWVLCEACRVRTRWVFEQEKGIWWMPWRQEAMKDVARCENLGGAASRR